MNAHSMSRKNELGIDLDAVGSPTNLKDVPRLLNDP